jgi:hypothetical protein
MFVVVGLNLLKLWITHFPGSTRVILSTTLQKFFSFHDNAEWYVTLSVNVKKNKVAVEALVVRHCCGHWPSLLLGNGRHVEPNGKLKFYCATGLIVTV